METQAGTNRDLIVPVALVGVIAIVAFAVGVAGIALAVTSDDDDDDGAAAAVADPGAGVVEVSLVEMAIQGDLVVPPGPVVLSVTNAGSAQHDLVLDGGPGTPVLNPGESAMLDLGTLEPGSYTLSCTIAGHRGAGMEAELVVSGDAPPPGDDHGAHGGHDDMADPDALDAAMADSIERYLEEHHPGPAVAELEPEAVEADGTKVFRLRAEITDWEVETGKVVQAWSYNGVVPGPTIRVDLGDRVRVHVENRLPLGTDVHWHGVRVPFDQDGVAPLTQPVIRSGEDFTYEFVADQPAIGMYHAHIHGHKAIPNGLFGAFITGETPIPYGQTISGRSIPEDLEPALEFPMILNDAGVIGLTINGLSFPSTELYSVEQGDWIVTHYYNEGLQVHPMHLHQFPQLVFAKDGIPLDQPYWADTVNVAPGERYSVLVEARDVGTWVWHCHILTHVERDEGMFGMVAALNVE